MDNLIKTITNDNACDIEALKELRESFEVMNKVSSSASVLLSSLISKKEQGS